MHSCNEAYEVDDQDGKFHFTSIICANRHPAFELAVRRGFRQPVGTNSECIISGLPALSSLVEHVFSDSCFTSLHTRQPSHTITSHLRRPTAVSQLSSTVRTPTCREGKFRPSS